MGSDTAPTVNALDSSGQTVSVPSIVHCGLVILAIKLSLRFLGYEKTLQRVRRHVELPTVSGIIDDMLIAKTEHAVAMAGALYPGRALCLEQSLALYYLLRRRGAAVTFCQGVQPHPFQAHAWVEYGGTVINDAAEHVKAFARLPEQLP